MEPKFQGALSQKETIPTFETATHIIMIIYGFEIARHTISIKSVYSIKFTFKTVIKI